MGDKKKIYLYKSEKPDKLYKMKFENKTVHFGSGKPTGKGNYIMHKDDKIKSNWIKRHSVRENWNDPKTAGALSRHILWSEKTLDKSIKHFENKFKNFDIIKKV